MRLLAVVSPNLPFSFRPSFFVVCVFFFIKRTVEHMYFGGGGDNELVQYMHNLFRCVFAGCSCPLAFC